MSHDWKTKEFKERRILECNEHAKSKGGQCLSNEYINASHKLEWKCSNPKHKSWFASFNHIHSKDKWCPECAKEIFNQKHCIDEKLEVAKLHALEKGGQCLSEEYLGSREKLKWKCSNEKHQPWLAIHYDVVQRNKWCPECAKNHKAEDKARIVIESFFKKKFINCRPEWNINPSTNYPLELDIFNEELALAFEYDGPHHYLFNTRISDEEKRMNSFFNVLINDFIKEYNCKKNGISLYRIKAFSGKWNFKRFYEHLRSELNHQGISLCLDKNQLKEIECEIKKI